MKPLSFAPLLALSVLLLVPLASAQCDWQRLVSSTSQSYDAFGSAVDVQGTRAVVGAERESGGYYLSGKAFVFELVAGQWVETAAVWSSDGARDDEFGSAVALDGDTFLVSASGRPAVYFFEKQGSGWIETAKFERSGMVKWHSAMALQGDLAFIGEPYYRTPHPKCGAVHVLERSGSSWVEREVLIASDASENGYFGSMIALDGDELAIGATGGVERVYIFESTPQGFVETGSFAVNLYDKISFSDDWILAGSPYDWEGPFYSGAVYFCHRVGNQWTVEKVKASDAQQGDRFGTSVSLSGSRAIVGMPLDGAYDKGAAYLYELLPSGWIETLKLTSPDHLSWAAYGDAVEIDEQGTVIVGAPGAKFHDTEPRVYTYVFDGADCNGNGVPDFCDLADGTSADVNGDGIPDECTCDMGRYCVANPNSTGAASSISAMGVPSISANDWSLRATSCPPLQFGLFFYGRQQNQVPFGNGWRCVDGQIFRLPAVQSDPAGEATWTVDFTNPPQPAGVITPGATWNFQFWYRDPAAGGSDFNLSDGLTVNFCL
jgi:hypothetical protein